MKKTRSFKSLSESEIQIHKKFFFSVREELALSTILNGTQMLIISTICHHIRMFNRSYNSFRIPFADLETYGGISRKKATGYLKGIKDLNFIVMNSPGKWSWNLPALFRFFVQEETQTQVLVAERISAKIRMEPLIFGAPEKNLLENIFINN